MTNISPQIITNNKDTNSDQTYDVINTFMSHIKKHKTSIDRLLSDEKFSINIQNNVSMTNLDGCRLCNCHKFVKTPFKDDMCFCIHRESEHGLFYHLLSNFTKDESDLLNLTQRFLENIGHEVLEC